MMEFWIDPQSPYYKPFFGEDKLFVFYCAGAWRSAPEAVATEASRQHASAKHSDPDTARGPARGIPAALPLSEPRP